MPVVTIEEAKAHLDTLIEQLQPGEEMLIMDHGQPPAQVKKKDHEMKLRMNQYMDLSLAAIVVVTLFGSIEAKASSPTTFAGEKTAWHGFDRYDFLMDQKNLTLKPIKAAADEKNGIKGQVEGHWRCIVVVPKEAAPGNPWSWRGCYWDHEPQAEVELLKRGFHIAFVGCRPGQALGCLVRVPHREAWAVQEAGLHRHEQGRSQRVRLDHRQPRQGFVHLRGQSRDQAGGFDEARGAGQERCAPAEYLRQSRFSPGTAYTRHREPLSPVGWPDHRDDQGRRCPSSA